METSTPDLELATGWVDAVSTAVNPNSETTALAGSTEAEQFHH
jgi:isocitrate lyase